MIDDPRRPRPVRRRAPAKQAHSGRGVGRRAVIVIVPHARLGTVMLSNIEGERLDEHARGITAFLLESVEASGGVPDLLRLRPRQAQPALCLPGASRARGNNPTSRPSGA